MVVERVSKLQADISCNECVSCSFRSCPSSKLVQDTSQLWTRVQSQREAALAIGQGRHRLEAANAATCLDHTSKKHTFIEPPLRLRPSQHIQTTQATSQHANMAGDPRALLRQVGHLLELSHNVDN